MFEDYCCVFWSYSEKEARDFAHYLDVYTNNFDYTFETCIDGELNIPCFLVYYNPSFDD